MRNDYVTGLPRDAARSAYAGPVKFENGSVVRADGSPISSNSIMTNGTATAQSSGANNQLARRLGLPNCTDAQAMQLSHKVAYLTPPQPIEIPYQLDNADGSPVKDMNKPTIIDNSENFDREAVSKWYDETFVTDDPQGRTGVLKAPDPAKNIARHKAYHMSTPPVQVFPYQLDNADGSPVKDINKPTVIDNSKNFDKEAVSKWYDETFVTDDPQGRAGVLKAYDPAKLEAIKKANYANSSNTPLPHEAYYGQEDSSSQELTPYQQNALDRINGRKEALTQRFGTKVIPNSTLNRNMTPVKQDDTPQYISPSELQSGVEVNGKIDKDFSQGQTGNCWFLSSLQAIRDKQGGQEYLNSLISVDNTTGDVTVNLKGAGKSYTIPKSEIESRSQLSSGDGDVRALEIAMDRYMKETCPDRSNNGIDGGYSTKFAMETLIGKSNLEHDNIHQIPTQQESFTERDGVSIPRKRTYQTPYWAQAFDVNNFNSNNKAYTVSFEGSNTNSVAAVSTTTNGVKSLTNNHAYSVVKADNEFVYLRNPHNTAEILKVAVNDFNALNSSIYSTNL